MNALRFVGLFLVVASPALAGEYLVRFHANDRAAVEQFAADNGGTLALVSAEGGLYRWTSDQAVRTLSPGVEYVQRNHVYSIEESPSLTANRAALLRAIAERGLPAEELVSRDKPDIQQPGPQGSGADPLLSGSWGMFKVGADKAWAKTNKGKGIVVAVTDTGLDYNHPDIIHNVWRNPKEVANNGVDDDENGYVDDVVGWDFAMNDNKPFDITKSLMEILFQGGNPGHGTHVSGVVGASLNNGIGVAGVAPDVKIMALRFITEDGKGDTANAVKAIDYAIKNGANVINASWGGEAGDEDDKALTEAIQRAQTAGVIFVAAAGNGRLNQATGTSAGFDNDNDPKPMVPAAFPIANIVTVAAVKDDDSLAPFSNWGKKSCKLAAPGVKILSTVPGGKYQDTIIDMGGIKATWDGTSMAAPFVTGALAVVWSQNPSAKWQEVRDALLAKVSTVTALGEKVATGGRLSLVSIE